jgi:predicted amidohydrolase YtcJ
MQATHATSDMNMAEDRVGSERIKGGYAWQKFLDQGTVIANGSDFPVEHVNPFFGLYSSVTRQDHEGNPPNGWYPEERLSREETLRSFTLDAAFAAHQEDVLGSLEPGKWADFIIIDRDFFEVPAIEIWQTKVLETWVAGDKVYGNSD